jgi:hypothetical protein
MNDCVPVALTAMFVSISHSVWAVECAVSAAVIACTVTIRLPEGLEVGTDRQGRQYGPGRFVLLRSLSAKIAI